MEHGKLDATKHIKLGNGAGRSPGRWSLAASGGSIVTAALASVCCVGPLVLALLGIGGAGFLLKFEPYRPFFTVGTVAMLGAGFYLTYRKPHGDADQGDIDCDCPTPRTNKLGKIMLWIASLLVVGFLAFPYLAPIILG